LEDYVRPLSSILFGDIGSGLDSHHSFIVQYKLTEERSLNFHYDESEITVNVCLGKVFNGGTLYFKGIKDDENTKDENFEFNHVVGRSLMHLGKHTHGAKSISSGERFNLIMWFRNSKQRNQHANDHQHQHDENCKH